MNTFCKLPEGDWAVRSTLRLVPGETVPVALRSGATKQVTIGEHVYSRADHHVFSVAPVARPAAQTVGDLSGIMALFDRAKRHLRFPTIVLAVAGHAGGVRISVAGARARVPGSLTITSNERNATGRRDWFGRVLTSGAFEPSRDASPAITDHLRALAADPAHVAAEHGRLTGKCCFCNRPLTDERSTAVGYGATCADNFGLAWGARPAEFAARAA